MRVVWVAVGWFVLLAAAVGAQPEASSPPPPKPAAGPAEPTVAGSMEVAAHLWAVIGRYRFAATADRVRVTLVRPGGRSDMHSLVVRCVPGSAGLARLEFDDLTLVARRGGLRAVHGRDPTAYAEIPASESAGDPASVLRDLLPPLAIPQLSLAFDPAEVDWCPLVSGLMWESAERVAFDGHDGVRLRGRTDVGEASLDLVAARVRRFEADLDSAGGTRLIVECEPLEPSDPAGWALDLTGRRRTDSLRALRALGAAIVVGGRMPRLSALLVGRPEERVLGAEEGDDLGAETRLRAAVLMRDDTAPEQSRAIAEALLGGVIACRRDLLRGRIDGVYSKRLRLEGPVGVVLAETTGGILERIDRQAEAWRAAVEAVWPAESEGPELVWAADEGRVVDRLAPGAQGVLVLYDGRGTIRAILPLGAGTSVEAVRASLVAGAPGIGSPGE